MLLALYISSGIIFIILVSIFTYKLFFKRVYDILFSFLLIVILSPLFLMLIIIGAINMKGNPFFVQKRPGKNEKIFHLIKFRSMNNKVDSNGNLLEDEERITKYGKFLRSTSVDELPELFNVFLGKMSLVGPRPLLVRYLKRYSKEQHHRHDVRPGITGYSQVHGRNKVNWDDKFKMDLYYIKQYSLFLDISILLKTIFCVFKKTGINSDTSATMEEFLGNKPKEID